MIVRDATVEDVSQVLSLHKRVASIPGGIARLSNDVSETYVREFLT
jgi:hypothetical protein